jgi:hypothetical protein
VAIPLDVSPADLDAFDMQHRFELRARAPDVVVWQGDRRPLPGRGYGDPIAARLGRLGARVVTSTIGRAR